MSGGEEMQRRRTADSAIDGLAMKLDRLVETVNSNHSATITQLGHIDTKIEVHITEDKAVAETVADHKKRWEGVDQAKNRGLIFAGLALLSSGFLGAWGKDIAQTFKKVFLE